MANIEQVVVPDIGDFKDVEIIEVLVAVGDQVSAEQSLITLESDKASMEVPSPKAGRVKELKVALGDRVSEGSAILTLELEDGGEDSAAASARADEAKPTPGGAAADAGAPSEQDSGEELVEVKVPDIGDFKDVEVIEVLVAEGDEIKAEQSLITLESDKASMEVPSPQAGRIESLKVKLGDRVSEGSAILSLRISAGRGGERKAGDKPRPPTADDARDQTSARQAQAPGKEPSPAAESRPRPAPTDAVDAVSFRKAHASPAVRRFARELGADIGRIAGSGPKGRILKEDVKAWVKRALTEGVGGAAPAAAGGAGIPPIPEVDFSQFGEIETTDLPRIKRISGPHLHRAWLNLPMVTHHDEADITEMEDFRQSLKAEAEQQGVRVTALVFIMKALVDALRLYPNFNASLSDAGQKLVYKKYFHIGVAVDTPNGLVVPVIRDVDRKGIYELSGEIAELSKKARDGKLKPAEMQGGCISISSLGGIGGTAFTPIVNAPEVAILGVTRARMQPVWNGKEFMPRLMLPLDLTYDHRVIDGADAARFCARLARTLGDVRRLIL